jgi:hypothetical protein
VTLHRCRRVATPIVYRCATATPRLPLHAPSTVCRSGPTAEGCLAHADVVMPSAVMRREQMRILRLDSRHALVPRGAGRRYHGEVIVSRDARMHRLTVPGRWLVAAALARLTQAALAALLVHASLALAQTDLLQLNALVQEGDLILEEAAALAPANQKLEEEGPQIAASDTALRAAAQALEDGIKQFNASMQELNVGAKQHQAQCPQQIEEPARLESCNAQVAELNELARKLDEQRPGFEAQRKELNARVDQHNQVATDFARHKQEYDSRDTLNQHDAEDWLGRARSFLGSETFNAFLVKAASPTVCGPGRIAELATLPTRKAVTRAQDCLKAVKAGAT